MTALDSKPVTDTKIGIAAAAEKRLPFLQLGAALLSGFLLALAYPHADFGWLAFIALVPFLRNFPYARTRTAFFHGFIFGFAYFATLLYWIAVFAETKIGPFGIGAWLILSSRESLYIGLFAVGINFIWQRSSWPIRAVAAACLWTALEWIRQLGALGFGWGDLAYSQWHFLPLIQIAAVTGLWGVTFVIVLVNTALASCRPKLIAGAVLTMVLLVIGGALRMYMQPHTTHAPAAASLQTNINEDVAYWHFRPKSSAFFYNTLEQFDTMAAQAKERNNASICVTAETSAPGDPELDTELSSILSGIAVRHGITLIVGGWGYDYSSKTESNSAFVYRPDGTTSAPYVKQQLVPFGEYVPLISYIPLLKSFHVVDLDFQAGPPNQPPLDVCGRAKAGIAICYESTYPRFLREQVARGATFDVVMTDDTWYGKTAAAKQHEAMSILRAVETDRYLVRSAETGVSAVVSPTGQVLSSADIFKQAVVAAPIQQRFDLTPFVRFGDWFPMICLASFSFLALCNRRRGS